MALNWEWKEKCGEVVLAQGDREYTISLYKGNAYLILIHEYQEEGKEKYTLVGFFLDKEHAKRCLGLAKGTSNIYDEGWQKITKLRINKKKHSQYKELVSMFAQAFDNIIIEVVSE